MQSVLTLRRRIEACVLTVAGIFRVSTQDRILPVPAMQKFREYTGTVFLGNKTVFQIHYDSQCLLLVLSISHFCSVRIY